MKFDQDVIDAVGERAPNGIQFEDAEIIAALTKAAERVADATDFYAGYGTLVEQVASKELRRRNPRPPKPPRKTWAQRLFQS